MIRFGTLPDEDIVYNNSTCQLKVNSGEFHRGTVTMTNSEICWKRIGSPETGFMIPWEKITVQAITQDPQRCVYFMIDVSWPADDPALIEPNNGNPPANGNHDEEPNGDAEDDDEGNESEGSVQEITEFYIIPDSPDDVDELYFVMSKFPVDPPMEDSSDDDFFDGENLEHMNINDEERFADAE